MFDTLCEELLYKIFTYLSFGEIQICRQVNRRWNRIGADHTLWRNYVHLPVNKSADDIVLEDYIEQNRNRIYRLDCSNIAGFTKYSVGLIDNLPNLREITFRHRMLPISPPKLQRLELRNIPVQHFLKHTYHVPELALDESTYLQYDPDRFPDLKKIEVDCSNGMHDVPRYQISINELLRLCKENPSIKHLKAINPNMHCPCSRRGPPKLLGCSHFVCNIETLEIVCNYPVDCDFTKIDRLPYLKRLIINGNITRIKR